MANLFDHNNCNDTNDISPLIPVLINATQLGANYDLWKDNEIIQDVLNMEKNFFCKLLKTYHSYLDEKSIKCIALAVLIHMYNEMTNMISTEKIKECIDVDVDVDVDVNVNVNYDDNTK